MKFEEIRQYDRAKYEQTCGKCGKLHEVRTQEDNHPEYYTAVYVKCICGDYVRFELPVN